MHDISLPAGQLASSLPFGQSLAPSHLLEKDMHDWGWKLVILPYVAISLVQSNWSLEQQPPSSVPPGQSSLPSHLLHGSMHVVSLLRFGMPGYIIGQAVRPREQTIWKEMIKNLYRWITLKFIPRILNYGEKLKICCNELTANSTRL